MTVHRYPAADLRGDRLRAAAGLALTAGPLLVVGGLHPLAVWLLGGGGLVFGVFAVRTLFRGFAVFELTSGGIRRLRVSTIGAREVNVPWSDLTRLRLRYYTTGRNREGGWMQLGLAAGRATLRIESGLDGFRTVAREAVRAARARGLTPGRATLENLRLLDISWDAGAPDAGAADSGAPEDQPRDGEPGPP